MSTRAHRNWTCRGTRHDVITSKEAFLLLMEERLRDFAQWADNRLVAPARLNISDYRGNFIRNIPGSVYGGFGGYTLPPLALGQDGGQVDVQEAVNKLRDWFDKSSPLNGGEVIVSIVWAPVYNGLANDPYEFDVPFGAPSTSN